MRRILFAIPALVIGLVGAAKPDDDATRLQGRWLMESLVISGEDAPWEQVVSANLVVEGEAYTPKFNDAEIHETFKLDPSQTPGAIDFTYIEGPRKGESVKGIYKLEGDRYTLCRPLKAEDERPKQFATTSDSGLVVVVWKRDTPAERTRRKAIEDAQKAMSGTWTGVMNRRDGRTVPDDEATNARLIITNDRYTLERDGNKASRGTCKIDPSKTPNTIDISIIDGINKGQNWLGIYEVNGNEYRSCFSVDGKTRPSVFASEPGSGHIFWVFKR